jgi:two-component system CheB/CheR fusion protein
MVVNKNGTKKKNAIPTHPIELESSLDDSSHTSFPIVGIGASAGGLAAFEAFFSGMPAAIGDPGMAFILVQHLAPDHKSLLTEIIQRYTRMKVYEVEDGMVVKPNCTYIIPPKYDMAFINGTLQLLTPSAPHGQRLTIDFFFRSLALDQHERAICVVLSGTGSDGTIGARAIKAEGGMVMAQSPDSTEFDSMPCSAIATGLVDYELAPAAMPAQLISYVSKFFKKETAAISSPIPVPDKENALKKIFILLRAKTGHDFSLYKINTINRRIERRMVIHQIETIDQYVKFLQQTTTEIDTLFRDLLIGVTSFFRDSEAFKVIEDKVIPSILSTKLATDIIRIWTPGCSTGEEAYSLAILFAERLMAMKLPYKVQVFATDIDSQAIATARTGIYPASIAADISPDRLERFFTKEANGDSYRIHKGIRDMLIFSEQDVIKDPPFSKLQLISCRNMMIYMGGDLQKKLIPLFHYALNPGGVLFLGTSETVGDFNDLFTPIDRKSKIYKRRDEISIIQRVGMERLLPQMATMNIATPNEEKNMTITKKLPLRELTEQALLQQVVHAAALINCKGNILYLYGRTGMYLEPTPGEAGINNILKMAREGLLKELYTALKIVIDTKEILHTPGIRVKTNGHFTMVDMVIRPVISKSVSISDESLYLVILQESAVPPEHTSIEINTFNKVISNEKTSDENESLYILKLKEELRTKEEYLQTANEEMKSSNEEMQSVNEELQSTNEELETSKEELQSINEELITVNGELQNKVADLSRANNDMNNLLSGTGIATIFVDYDMRILRFTPFAAQIINLIIGDIGRPIVHIVSNLIGYNNLQVDIKSVLDTLIPKEVEVKTISDQWYTMHIQPYRTLDNVIEGAVITFVDITDMKNTRESLRKANELVRLAVVVRDSHDAITVQDMTGRIIAWNPGAVRMYGWSEEEALLMNTHDRIPNSQYKEEINVISQLANSQVLEPYKTKRIAKDGTICDVMLISTALIDENGQMYAISTTERIIK